MSSVVLRHVPQRDPQITVKSLNSTFVAEVGNIDLARPLDAESIVRIRDALIEHKLLVFRGQKLTPQQSDFAANFGPLHVHPLLRHDDELAEIIVLDYDRNRPREPDERHADVTLHDVVIPEVDLAAAYAALSEPLRTFLHGVMARHDFTKSFRARTYFGESEENNPPVTHPVVRTTPETGIKSLFVNEGFTAAIEELNPDESRALLELLIAHQAKPQFTYRHRWRTGDVLYWDNRITQRMVVADDWPQRRRMHRATIPADRRG